MMESFPLTKNYNMAKGEILVAKPLYLLHLLKQNKKFLAALGIDMVFVDNIKQYLLGNQKWIVKKKPS